jgi:hypothetical protein
VLASINDIPLADGTLPGGFALADFRISVARLIDIVFPIGALNPLTFDRTTRESTLDFMVSRVHDSPEDAELYIAAHDAAIPSSGPVQVTTSDGEIRYLMEAKLITHQLIRQIGKTTFHSYHIEGGQISLTDAPAAFFILTEDGFYILTEDGFKIELE